MTDNIQRIKRKHNPKKNASCGSCAKLLNEDVSGNGVCDEFNIQVNCTKKACCQHVQKRNTMKRTYL